MASNKPSKASSAQVEQMTCARIPTDMGEFQLCHYRNNQDDKEHLAFVCGNVSGKRDVLVRVHSECFTGDTMGSLRCDCGPQLRRAMQLIAAEDEGVIIYLRQEGRNIGLLDKLRAYNLQDAGYDTVEANLLLGHQADNRDYLVAALILKDLGITSIRLLTNNPQKIESLENHGVQVSSRIPLQEGVNEENVHYLRTKAQRMRHMLDLELLTFPGNGRPDSRPFVTLSYAQSLDGSISARRGEQLHLSGPESMLMTHRLRAEHDAILVGIGTVLSDDPRLTVRLVEGQQPTPIVLDSYLRTPPAANLLRGPKQVLIATRNDADSDKARLLERAGAQIIRLPAYENGYVDLPSLLGHLAQNGIRSLMVEGGATVITSFLKSGLVDRLAVTVTPNLVGGLSALESDRLHGFSNLPSLHNTRFRQLGSDLVVIADVIHENE